MRAVLAVLALLIGTPVSAEPCRLALALALDVSGSVDQTEYRLQLEGLAAALTDPEVEAAVTAVPGAPVALSVYEWSSSRYQRLLQDWVLINDAEDLRAVAGRLTSVARAPAPEATGLTAAMEYGRALIDRGPACWTATLDVSGDGKNNDWPAPRQAQLGDLRVNALVVILEDRGEAGELPAYFRAEIIRGPDAFVEVARGFEDYARAMKRKLLRELATRPVGALSPRREYLRRF